MKKLRRRWPYFMTAVAALGAIVTAVWWPREPEYRGKQLSEWVEHHLHGDSAEMAEAEKAFRAMGPDAVPWLLRRLESRPDGFLNKYAEHIEVRALQIWQRQRYDHWNQYRAHALYTLGLLGEAASPGLPTYVHILKSEGEFGWLAADAIAATGEAGKPALRAGLSDTNTLIRVACAAALARHASEEEMVRPHLLAGLNNPDSVVRAWATGGLGRLKAHHDEMIPKLTELLEDPDLIVVIFATEALGEIGAPANSALPSLTNLLTHPVAGPFAGQAIKRIRWKDGVEGF
jgi:HEAT repeat protein